MSAIDWKSLTGMIVDDKQHMRLVVSAVLRGLEVRRILTADDGADALEHLRLGRVDFAIVDYQMKPIDGIEFTHFLRRSTDSPNRTLPIIMMTGHGERRVVFSARDAGVDEFIVKPVTARTIYLRTLAALARRRPFVDTARYAGPCRRRIAGEPPVSGERRASSEDGRVNL